jgi:voltage-gated potassium channel Kch
MRLAMPRSSLSRFRRRSGSSRSLLRPLRRHSFRVLLVPLLVLHGLLALPDVLAIGSVAVRLAWLLLIGASLYALSGDPRVMRVAAVFAALLLGTDWLSSWVHPHRLQIAHLVLALVFFTWMVGVVLREVFVREAALDADALLGAVSGYLLLVILFAELHLLVETIAPGSFLLHGAPLPADLPTRTALLHYFSTVTATTLGYGDVVPATPVARLVAGSEALVGQLYVAIVIAAFVGREYRDAARRARHPGDS